MLAAIFWYTDKVDSVAMLVLKKYCRLIATDAVIMVATRKKAMTVARIEIRIGLPPNHDTIEDYPLHVDAHRPAKIIPHYCLVLADSIQLYHTPIAVQRTD